MVSIVETLLKDRQIKRLNDLDVDRFLTTYKEGYQENLECMTFILDKFPRWSIVLGYFAMHDISKLLIVKKMRVKVDFDAHTNTIRLLEQLVKIMVHLQLKVLEKLNLKEVISS